MTDLTADIVLVGHGSQRTAAFERGLQETGRRLQRRYQAVRRVRIAFFEFLEPTLEQALQGLIDDGSRQIIVMPYFLFDGREVTVDLPHRLADLRQRWPSVAISQAASLGLAEPMISIIAERVEGALIGLCQYPLVAGRLPVRRASGPHGVIVVNRGSRAEYDDGRRLQQLAKLTAERLGAPVEAAQAEYSQQTIEVAARRLVAAGVRQIVVVPYLHHPGKVLFVNILPAIERASQAHPATRFLLAWTLCVDDRLVDLCVARIAAAGADQGSPASLVEPDRLTHR